MLAEVLIPTLRPLRFRGKARILHAVCPREGVREASLFGFPVALDLQNFIERSIYLNTFEPWETRAVSRYLRPGMVVVDAGANVGYYTLMASAAVGDAGHVYAFEPAPYALDKLRAWAGRAGNVTVEAAALGSRDGEGVLNLPPTMGNYTPNMVPGGSTGSKLTIPVRSLDSYLRERGIPRVDLLKMDVEGFEPEIVEGARASLASGVVRAVLCEFNREWLAAAGSSPAALYETICGFGLKSQTAFLPDSDLQNILFTLA